MKKYRFGEYAYLDDSLLDLISVEGGYEFITDNESIIRKYNFREKKSAYSNYISYRLKALENTGIKAFQVSTYCTYKGFKFFVENFFDEKYILRPLEEAQTHFKDVERQGYDPVYEVEESKITDIWEERTPIEGFKFDVEPIYNIKKDGKFL
mgnify:CR=1 FL=1